MDIADIRKAVAADPDLLKSLTDFVGEKDRAANLEAELEQLKADFNKETEELVKSLTEAEENADRAEEARKAAERAVAEVIFRQDALQKCLVEAIGPAIKDQAEKTEQIADLVKALAERPVPARAVSAVQTPEEIKPEPAEVPAVDFDVEDVLSKAMTKDIKAGNKGSFPTWTALRRAERDVAAFKTLAQKEGLL